MRIGSLFAGIGGFDLAAGWVGWETAWFSEVDEYASRVLAKNFPNVPNHGDITQIGSGRAVEPSPVDILVGGFPCQDISLAGKGEGIEGSRSGLWKHYKRLIDELRPRWVVAENVSALRSRGLDVVLSDLAEIGYDAEWHCIPASAVGAPHQRDRIWIIAYPAGTVDGSVMGHADSQREPSLFAGGGGGGGAAAAPEGSVDAVDAGSGGGASGHAHGDVDHAQRTGLEGHAGHGDRGQGRAQAAGSTAPAGVSLGGYSPEWWASEPDVGRVAHGVPARVDRLRCLGNAIVPQVAYAIFQCIAAAERA